MIPSVYTSGRILFVNFVLVFRSIVDFNKITPLSAEKQILDKFYGRTKKFTNAVNQLKRVLRNLDEEKNKERTEREEAKKRNDEQRKLIEKVKQRTIKIVLTKLKPEEIEKWTKSPKSFSMVLRKR